MKIYSLIQNIVLILAGLIILMILSLYFIFNIYPVVVVSGSMEPDIPTGSVVFIDGDERNVRVGDIIAYKNNNVIVIHRVIERLPNENSYITKGDNNDIQDFAPVLQKQIIGKKITSIPKLGYIVMWMQSRSGIICTVTFIIVFILIGQLLKHRK